VNVLAMLADGRDVSWQPRAACRDHPHPELWFPENADSRNLEPYAICAACPVRAECLEFGMTERFGIWGGASDRERRRLRRQRLRRVAA
jgi:WhiB family redox-sensing transcriptional regulator